MSERARPTLSLADARRVAITAQGLATPRPAQVDAAALRALFDRLAVVQLDSVNVLARSHYLVVWSRLGAYALATLDALSYAAPRALFEYWGHEASLLPVDLYPAMRWRMARAKHDAWGRMRAMGKRRAFVGKVLAAIEAHGPVRVADIDVEAKPRAGTGWWEWSEVKVAVEWLFWSGLVTAAKRQQFERFYDLPARVIPPAQLHELPIAEAVDTLVERSARAMGLGTEADLRDYFRLPLALARASIARLVERGVLEPISVEGWKPVAYRHRETPPPADCVQNALLSPFDSLIWMRDRTQRLFDMRVRLEVYTPAEKRVHGYYVLPFLLGDQLVARVDLKADRAAGALLVQAAHLEPGQTKRRVAPALAAELAAMAGWLGLSSIVVVKRGDLAASLARAV